MSIPLLRLSAAAAFLCCVLTAQTPPAFRAGTRVVQIHVEVSGKNGAAPPLSKDDFTVTDEGKRREIRIFRMEDPGTAAGPEQRAAVLPPNIFTNLLPAARSPVSVTVILLDAINNYWDHLVAARARLAETFRKLRADERIALYAASTRPAGIVLLQEFTTDRARLLRAMEDYVPPIHEPAPGMFGPPRAPQLAGYAPKPAIPESELEFRMRSAMTDTMSAFTLLAEHLGKLPGRKRVMWITSGLPARMIREMPEPLDKAVDALNEADVAVNVMDDDGVGSPRRRWGREAFLTLREMSNRTGGKAYLGRNDLENTLAEAIQAKPGSYLLGFYLSEQECDERFHRLTVRVNRPGLELSYRKGYYAGTVPPPDAPRKREPLENTLLDAQESAEIAIAAEVMVMPGEPPRRLRVELRLGGADLSMHWKDGVWSGKLEEMFIQTNAAGQPLAKAGDAREYQVKGADPGSAGPEVVPVQKEIVLVEGATRLLVVFRDSESGRIGSLSIPLAQLQPAR